VETESHPCDRGKRERGEGGKKGCVQVRNENQNEREAALDMEDKITRWGERSVVGRRSRDLKRKV